VKILMNRIKMNVAQTIRENLIVLQDVKGFFEPPKYLLKENKVHRIRQVYRSLNHTHTHMPLRNI
jgi:acetylglutamate kinase